MSLHLGETGPLDETLREYRIPPHLHEGIIAWVTHGRPPGHFLWAVITNNLREAIARADSQSEAALGALVRWMYMEAPGICWGSQDRAAEWITRKRAEREVVR